MLPSPGPGKSYRFTFAVFGNRGTVYPLLAVGRALLHRGHRVTFATPERYHPEVIAAGLTPHTLRPDVLEKKEGNPGDTESGLRDIMFPAVEDTFRDLLSAAKDADVLVFPMFLFPGPMAAERLDIPWVETHLAPGTLNSIYDPPFIPPVSWLYPLQRLTPLVPRIFNRLAARAIRSWYAPYRALREREGFPPDNSNPLLGGMRSPWLTLALFSGCVGPAQKDWPQPTVTTGFPFFDEHEDAHTEVQRFLDAGDPPIVVTLGSVISDHRRDFYLHSIAAARQLGRRVLIIAGADHAALPEQDPDGRVLTVAYAPYSNVFPRACALVVSGSIGPISHALRAGRPTLIVPAETAADQPDNALRTVCLGAARSIMLGKYTPATAAEHLGALLSDPAYAQNAERLGQRIRSEDATASACNALEDLLATRARRVPA